MTDGEPDGGKHGFYRELRNVVEKRSTRHTFKVQIMACTGDEDAVAWLNGVDKEFDSVDVTDDYYSELLQVLKDERTRKKFSRGDWCMKAMLGPINAKFDAWDERDHPGQKQEQSRPVPTPLLNSSKTAMLEDQCRCSAKGCIIS